MLLSLQTIMVECLGESSSKSLKNFILIVEVVWAVLKRQQGYFLNKNKWQCSESDNKKE